MTTIIKKYIGITHPINGEGLEEGEHDLILGAWRYSLCIQNIHLWDEVLNSDGDHYLVCDACGIEVHIEKIVIPDGNDETIGEQS